MIIRPAISRVEATLNQLRHLFISIDSPSAMSSPTPVAHKMAHAPRPKLDCRGLVFSGKYNFGLLQSSHLMCSDGNEMIDRRTLVCQGVRTDYVF